MKFNPATWNVLGSVLTFLVTLILDMTGKMPGSSHQIALATVGALGLNGAVHAFRSRGLSVAEQAAEAALTTALAAKHDAIKTLVMSLHVQLPGTLAVFNEAVSQAQKDFANYLDKNLPPQTPPVP